MGALDGYTVLDLSILVQGPQAASMLGDLGADVIKVELPEVGDLGRWITVSTEDGRSPYYEACNRGKRSVALDLRQPGGKRALLKLAEQADVLIHNFVPGTAEAWGIDYDDIRAVNPSIIYAAGSTFGPDGPNARREGADMVGQAEGGIVSNTGHDDGHPTVVGAVISDHLGAQNMITGILTALLHRERTGEGQRIDVSLVGSAIYAQASEMTYTMWVGEHPGRPNESHPIIRGLIHRCRTSDGYIYLIGVPEHLWNDFARCIDREDLIDDPRFATLFLQPDDLAELRQIADEVFPTRNTDEWEARLTQYGQRYGRVKTYDEIVSDATNLVNGYVREVEHPEYGPVTVVGNPIRLSATPAETSVVAPQLGQHTEEVLLEAGFSWEDIDQLRTDGAY
ncbi:MAG: CoA transferase [Actinomycetota bacterium]|jgi:CoA:oxalate CoA-transferase|nr:CoA transferase [Actinomycetota bacterium]